MAVRRADSTQSDVPSVVLARLTYVYCQLQYVCDVCLLQWRRVSVIRYLCTCQLIHSTVCSAFNIQQFCTCVTRDFLRTLTKRKLENEAIGDVISLPATEQLMTSPSM